MDMFVQKSIRTLELDRVLDKLASFAVCDAAKEACLALRPQTSLPEALRLQAQTTEARTLMGAHGSPVFSGVRDVGGALLRADRGGVLNHRELLDIAGVLRAARQAKSYFSAENSCLSSFFKSLVANRFLEDKITNAILSEEEMADIASPELAALRRHMRTAHGKIRETLQRMISSSATQKYLQDPIITMRGDRYVVPVKNEHRGDVPGLLHDVSSSGQTVFVEPMQVVSLNNEIRELAAKEQREMERILAEFSADVSAVSENILSDYQILVSLDSIFARAKLSYEMDACAPVLNQSGRLCFYKARHPLLPKNTAVPIDVSLGDGFDTLVITGPNTGGKTVTLKTLGLLTLMAACGLHIPVRDGSEAALFDMVLADIGDEQSIEQSLSTFSSHMTNIVKILQNASDNTLLLFDELGAGTDPVEGAALAVSIIQYARALGAKLAATTHYAELKSFALTTNGVENASCEFNVETLRPTYKLLIGIPGKSNAFAISQKLGLPAHIIQNAAGHVSAENARFEDVLTQLEDKRQAMESARQEAERLKLQAGEHHKKAEALHAVLEKEREGATERARAEARRIVAQARAEVDAILEEAQTLRQQALQARDAQSMNQARASLRQRLNQADQGIGGGLDARIPEAPAVPDRPLAAGDRVVLTRLGTHASVLSPPDKDGNVNLLAGIMKITAHVGELRLAEDKPPQRTKKQTGGAAPVSAARTASTELDLRGMSSDEAVMAMELFLDNAVLAGLHTLTIIHGKGTGVLRKAVQDALRKQRQVAGFRLGRYGEGEAGVTIVELK